ncbi:hypothetical protein J6590_014373, partial [Homalodisca vitripennis]
MSTPQHRPQGKILGSRHRHANDTNLHEKVSLAVFFNRRLGRGLLTCMKKSYENRLRKSVTFTASSRDLKVKPMSYNSVANRFVVTVPCEQRPRLSAPQVNLTGRMSPSAPMSLGTGQRCRSSQEFTTGSKYNCESCRHGCRGSG